MTWIKGGENMAEDMAIIDIPCTIEEKAQLLDILCALDVKPSYVVEYFLKNYKKQE